MREELDFKSLRFFSALYRLGNVSPAADALDISQPTGSLLLKKLRDHFADPLFVRVGQRMIPTPRADAIGPPPRRDRNPPHHLDSSPACR